MSTSDFEERVVTVPLRDVKAEPVQERADAAMRIIREHLAKHFKVETEDVRLDPALNEAVWSGGRSNVPSKLRVRAARFVEDGQPIVEAEPADE
jgi:large subunit ribosomal protein L31e